MRLEVVAALGGIAGTSLGLAFVLFATASLAPAGQVDAARGGHVRSHTLKEALP